MNEIILPWPSKDLSPNARVHWAVKAKAAKAYKQACWALTKEAKAVINWDGEVYLWITFVPPDRRSYDDDNLVGRFKYGRDGIALALGIDDKRFICHPFVATDIGGMVKVRFSRGPEA